MSNPIMNAIKTLYDNDINPWPDAMAHVFKYIEKLENKKPEAPKNGDVISHDRIMDEIIIWITRYLNDPDLELSKDDQSAIKALLERLKDTEEL